ncbi:MAG: RHS repeat-associated core domain-containing protein [Acidobacteriota bacterium]
MALDAGVYDPSRPLPVTFDAWASSPYASTALAPPASESWRRNGHVTARADHGAVLEVRDVNGRPTTSVLDRAGSRRIAEFTNGDLGEVSYAGFESYEHPSGWRLTDGGDLAGGLVDGDAHTGARSLRLEAGGPGLERDFSLRPGRRYVLSCWLKSEDGAAGDGAAAVWRLASAGATLATFDVEASPGEWSYRHVVIDSDEVGADVDGELLSATATLEALGGGVLVDDLFFSPLDGDAGAEVFHPRFGDPVAQVGWNGRTTRTLYDSYRRSVGEVDGDGEVVAASAIFFPRQAESVPRFASPEMPNSVVDIAAAGGGRYAHWAHGDAWKREWSGADLDGWRVDDGRLRRIGSGESTIHFMPTEDADDYGARVSYLAGALPDGGVAAPGGPVAVALGDTFGARWTPDDGWTVTLGGDAENVLSAVGDPTRSGSDWLLLAPVDPVTGETSVFFFVDGELLYARLDTPPVRGALRLTAESGAFSSVATFRRPQISQTFLDGAAKTVQGQAFDGSGVIVTGTVHDPIGREALSVKPVRLDGEAPRYRPDYVRHFDAESGVLEGLAADANPGDEGFPYTRTTFRRTAQSLSNRRGNPGKALAVVRGDANPHITRIEYGTNVAGQFSGDALPSSQYFVTRVRDANGDLSYTVTSQTDQEIARARGGDDGSLEVVRYLYDDAGRLSHVYSPRGAAALHAGEPDADAWATRYTYDFGGLMLTETTPDSGTSRFVYDPVGQLRFAQDAQAAADGLVTYVKFDAQGRTLEEGFFEGVWDRGALTERAKGEPEWPDASQPHTVLARHEYDGDGADRTLFGRKARTQIFDAAGDLTSEYHLRYDLLGQVLGVTELHPGFDAEPRELSYGYDRQGSVVKVGYPEGSPVPEVHRTFNSLGQLASVGDASDSEAFASYRYDPLGNVVAATQRLGAGGTGGAVERVSRYTPAGWPEETRFLLPDGEEVFGQHFTYTEGGHGGAGYFDGKIASVRLSGDGEDSVLRYRYDGLSRLRVAEDSAHPEHSLGVGEPLSYDADGNIAALTRGDTVRTYHQAPGTRQVDRITEDGETVDAYTYDRTGAVTSASRLDLQHVSYEPGTGRTRGIQVGEKTPSGASGATVSFQYDDGGERSLKTVESPGGAKRSDRLYLRGGGPQSLLEEVRTRVRDQEKSSAVQYIYGPEGLTALQSGDRRFTAVRDNLGSVRRVVDGDGKVVASYSYTPYGVTIVREDSALPDICVYRYTGQEFDAETGLYNFHARFYDPELGRFYDIDPAGKGASPYTFNENDAINHVDPDGREPMTAFLIIMAISTAVGAVASGVTYAVTHRKGDFKVGEFFLYATVGAVAGAAGGAAGYGAGVLATGALATVGVSTSQSVASGVLVGAASGAADGAISGLVNHVGVNLVEGRPVGEGLGSAVGMGAAIGAGVGAALGGITGLAHARTAKALAKSDQIVTGRMAEFDSYLSQFPDGNKHIATRARHIPGEINAAGASTGPRQTLGILGHGAADAPTTRFLHHGHPNTLTANQIAAQLQGFNGRGINMISCHAGQNGAARTLANRLQKPVRAANVAITALRDEPGPVYIKFHRKLQGGTFRTYYPSKRLTGWIALFGY